MDKKLKLSLRLELIWWIFTAIIVLGVLYPIFKATRNYPFFIVNTVYIAVLVTFTRYIFLLKHVFFARIQPLKILLVFLSIPFIFVLVEKLNYFQTYLDDNGLFPFFDHLPYNNQMKLSSYVYNEMLFFGVGSVIASVFFTFRLIISIWRVRNTGTV